MNKVILIGRLTRDPEVRSAGENVTVARFPLAVDRRFKKDGEQGADFPNIVAFGKTAEFIEKYIGKGVKIALEGRIQTGSYTDKNGVKRYTTDIIADNVEFAESKHSGAATEEVPPSDDGGEWLAIPEGIENELPFK